MSSVSLFKPEDESDTDFEAALQVHGLSSARHTRSTSRAVSLEITSSSSELSGSEDDDSESEDVAKHFPKLDARILSLKPGVLEAYSRFFEHEKGLATLTKVDETAEIFNVTQNGAVLWTATEKEKFFDNLDRKGKSGIGEIAAAIGTKSEIEVMDYLDFLHEGLIGQHMAKNENSTVIMSEIPAAVEIGELCRGQLDEVAEILAAKENANHAAALKKRFGPDWLITDRVAESLVNDESGEPLPGGLHLAAEIFNVPEWLKLSRHVYMNFGGKREGDHWSNLVQSRADSPSIAGDALMDFYAVTMSITRRVIQSSIFLTMSRLRQMQEVSEEDTRPIVRTEDVRTAIDVLNMSHNRGSLVFDAVRRNGLTVLDLRNIRGWKPQVLSYDEVEKILNRDAGDDEDDLPYEVVQSQERDDIDEDGDNEDESHEEEEEAEAEDQIHAEEQQDTEPELPAATAGEVEVNDADDEEEEDEDPPYEPELIPEVEEKEFDPPYNPARRLSVGSHLSSGSEEQASDAEEEHADRCDQEYHRIAELNLWNILHRPPPPSLLRPHLTEAEAKQDAENRPLVMRKTRRELTGWRDLTLYHSEWEEYGSDVSGLVEDLAENRRKRRKIEEEEALWDTGDETGDDTNKEEKIDQLEGGEIGERGPLSAEVVNSEEESDSDRMDVDEEENEDSEDDEDEEETARVSTATKSPSVAIELPKYGSETWNADLKSFPDDQAESKD